MNIGHALEIDENIVKRIFLTHANYGTRISSTGLPNTAFYEGENQIAFSHMSIILFILCRNSREGKSTSGAGVKNPCAPHPLYQSIGYMYVCMYVYLEAQKVWRPSPVPARTHLREICTKSKSHPSAHPWELMYSNCSVQSHQSLHTLPDRHMHIHKSTMPFICTYM